MEYRFLGSTGLKVSAIGLGCGNFGGVGSAPAFFGKGESEAAAHALLDAALEMGINFLDTADAYGGGRSERYIGSWLRAKGPRVRDQLLLSSKVFNPVGEDPNERGLSRRHVLRQVEASLSQLGADHLDLYLIHSPDPGTPIEETLRAFDDLIRQGKVRYAGMSNVPAWLLATSLEASERGGLHRFEWVQNSYSLLDRSDERELLPLLERRGLGFTPFSPLAGGWLTGKYRAGEPYPGGSRMAMRPDLYEGYGRAGTFRGLDALEKRATDRGTGLASLALAWVLSHPLVSAAIVGPRRPDHLEPARRAQELHLSPEERREIAALFEPGAGTAVDP